MADEPIKRKRRPNLSPLDRIRAQQQSKLAMEMERLAVLQYVGEQLAELNALLRDAGCSVSQMAFQQPPVHQPIAFQGPTPDVPQGQPQWPACAHCGPGKPTKTYNLGNGVIQSLCEGHARYYLADQAANAKTAAAGFSVNSTDARPQAPILNSAKTIMQPTQQDIQASQAHAQAANGTPQLPEGYEALEDES